MTLAVDTNIVLRLILNDDEAQVDAIRALMARTAIYVPLTVVLETGWVLYSRYGFSRAQVADAISGVAMLDGIEMARGDGVLWAAERFRAGADWADVIHLVAARKLAGFATLDQRIARRAGPAAPVPIETLT